MEGPNAGDTAFTMEAMLETRYNAPTTQSMAPSRATPEKTEPVEMRESDDMEVDLPETGTMRKHNEIVTTSAQKTEPELTSPQPPRS